MTLRTFASITLRDGRKLAFREYGQKKGFPVVFLHGNLNSRLFAPCWDKTEEETAAVGCRVIAVDRPGYGDSCFQPARRYSDTAHDITELIDHLQLPRVAVLGYSSGGPNAMACAALMSPARISALGLLSSDGPYLSMGPEVVQQMFSLTDEERLQTQAGAGALTEEMAVQRAGVNFRAMEAAFGGLQKEVRRELALADLHHAATQGLDKGPSQDSLLESSEWSFTLDQLQRVLSPPSRASSEESPQADGVPCVLWHGTDDSDVPVFVAEHLSQCLPSAELRLVQGESHSMVRRRWGEVLASVVKAASANAGTD